MPVESSLEVYKIILCGQTFTEIIRKKNLISSDEKSTETELFKLLFNNILDKLVQDAAWTTDKTKYGLALFKNNNEDINKIITCHSNKNVIEGYIDCGPYDLVRRVAQTNKVSDRKLLGKDQMVTDRYYIYLYCPMDSEMGLLFLEHKKGFNVYKAIQCFMEEIFKTKGRTFMLERYVPQSIIEEYKEDSEVDSFTFTDTIITPLIDENDIVNEENKCKVSIKKSLPEGERPNYDSTQNLLSKIGSATIKFGKDVKKLGDFRSRKGSLKKNANKYLFDISENLKIKPIIPIKEDIYDIDNSILKRDEIRKMCNEILDQIKKEIII